MPSDVNMTAILLGTAIGVLLGAALVFVVWLLPAISGIRLAERKGVSLHWMWFGLLPLGGWIALLVIRYVIIRVPCPTCGRMKKPNVPLCPHCSREAEPVPPAGPRQVVHFQCTSCGRPLVARAAIAGSRVRCPSCSAVLTVPLPLSLFVRKHAATEAPATCPTTVKIVAALLLGSGVLALLSSPATLLATTGLLPASEAQRLLNADPLWHAWTGIGAAMAIPVSLLWIIVSLRLFRLRGSAWPAAIWLLVFSMATSAASFCVAVKVFWVGPFPEGVLYASYAAQLERLFTFCFTIGSGMGGFIYCLFLFAALTKREVLGAFGQGAMAKWPPFFCAEATVILAMLVCSVLLSRPAPSGTPQHTITSNQASESPGSELKGWKLDTWRVGDEGNSPIGVGDVGSRAGKAPRMHPTAAVSSMMQLPAPRNRVGPSNTEAVAREAGNPLSSPDNTEAEQGTAGSDGRQPGVSDHTVHPAVKPGLGALAKAPIEDLTQAEAGDVWIHPKTSKRMVVVPTRYIGGTPGERGRNTDSGHCVLFSYNGSYRGDFIQFGSAKRFITGFLMDATEVTNAEYLHYMHMAKAPMPESWNGSQPDERKTDWPVMVTIDEAWSYAQWAGLSLPMFYEFCAAATGSDGIYPWRRDNFAGTAADSRVAGNLEDVSPLGICDLGGHAAEWGYERTKDFLLAFSFWGGGDLHSPTLVRLWSRKEPRRAGFRCVSYEVTTRNLMKNKPVGSNTWPLEPQATERYRLNVRNQVGVDVELLVSNGQRVKMKAGNSLELELPIGLYLFPFAASDRPDLYVLSGPGQYQLEELSQIDRMNFRHKSYELKLVRMGVPDWITSPQQQLLNQAENHIARKQYKDAMRVLRTVVSRYPGTDEAMQAEAKLKQLDTVPEVRGAVVRQRVDDWCSKQMEYGRECLKKGNRDMARQVFRQIIERYPNTIWANEARARLDGMR